MAPCWAGFAYFSTIRPRMTTALLLPLNALGVVLSSTVWLVGSSAIYIVRAPSRYHVPLLTSCTDSTLRNSTLLRNKSCGYWHIKPLERHETCPGCNGTCRAEDT